MTSLPYLIYPRDQSDKPHEMDLPHRAFKSEQPRHPVLAKTLPPPERSINPDFTRPGLGSVLHRRANHPGAPARLDLAPTNEAVSDGETYPSIATVAFYSPSAPIPIPARPNPPSRPTTPLTGRAAEGAGFPFSKDTPRKSPVGPSTYASPSPSSGSSRKTTSPSRSYSPFMSPSMMPREQPSHRIQPSSPLSPTMPLSPLLPYALHGRVSNRAGPHLQIPALPRLHPANFQSSDLPEADSSQRNRTNNSRRQFSDARHKLHKYQRDLIANATRSSRPVASQALTDLPPPRLHPLGSPGPVTPLALEENGDYLAAGTAASSYRLAGSAENELVERFIRQEQERTNHSGMPSDRHSPAVSPAGGRG